MRSLSVLSVPRTKLCPDSTNICPNAPVAVLILNVALVLSDIETCVEFAAPLILKTPILQVENQLLFVNRYRQLEYLTLRTFVINHNLLDLI